MKGDFKMKCKLLIRFVSLLSIFCILLSSTAFASETSNDPPKYFTYTIYSNDGQVKEYGMFPNSYYPQPKVSSGPVTLGSGETVAFNCAQVYAYKDTKMNLSYRLNRSAAHRYTWSVGSVALPSYTGTSNGRDTWALAPVNGNVCMSFNNRSSDPFTISYVTLSW